MCVSRDHALDVVVVVFCARARGGAPARTHTRTHAHVYWGRYMGAEREEGGEGAALHESGRAGRKKRDLTLFWVAAQKVDCLFPFWD